MFVSYSTIINTNPKVVFSDDCLIVVLVWSLCPCCADPNSNSGQSREEGARWIVQREGYRQPHRRHDGKLCCPHSMCAWVFSEHLNDPLHSNCTMSAVFPPKHVYLGLLGALERLVIFILYNVTGLAPSGEPPCYLRAWATLDNGYPVGNVRAVEHMPYSRMPVPSSCRFLPPWRRLCCVCFLRVYVCMTAKS